MCVSLLVATTWWAPWRGQRRCQGLPANGRLVVGVPPVLGGVHERAAAMVTEPFRKCVPEPIARAPGCLQCTAEGDPQRRQEDQRAYVLVLPMGCPTCKRVPGAPGQEPATLLAVAVKKARVAFPRRPMERGCPRGSAGQCLGLRGRTPGWDLGPCVVVAPAVRLCGSAS